MNRNHPVAMRLLALVLLASSATASAMPADRAAAEEMSSAQLRAAYLACEQFASGGRLHPALMQACACVADVLLQRDFGGDFAAQLQWWRAAREGFAGAGEPPAHADSAH